MVKDFKMVAQLVESDVEGGGDYVNVRSGGRYFERPGWLRGRGFERVGLATWEQIVVIYRMNSTMRYVKTV